MSRVGKIMAAVVIAGTMASWTATAEAASEGCTAASGLSCEYRATRAGGIVAIGNGWQVRIYRHGHEKAYGPKDMTDVRGSTLKLRNAVQNGDYVFVKTTIPAAPCLCLCVSGQFGAVAVGPDYNR
jgi:hypothetical protein